MSGVGALARLGLAKAPGATSIAEGVMGDRLAMEEALVTKGALERLKEAVQMMRAFRSNAGPYYARVVRAIADCDREGMTRKQIAAVIAEASGSDRGSKGLAARYVILHRYSVGEFTKRETPVHGVKGDDGQEYSSPVEMLESGSHGFRRTYVLWTRAAKMAVPEADRLAATLEDAAERWISRAMLRAKSHQRGVAVTKDPVAFGIALRAMLSQPMADSALGPGHARVLRHRVAHWLGRLQGEQLPA